MISWPWLTLKFFDYFMFVLHKAVLCNEQACAMEGEVMTNRCPCGTLLDDDDDLVCAQCKRLEEERDE